MIDGLSHTTIENLKIAIDCSAFYPGVVDIYSFEGEGIPFIRVNEITNLGLVSVTGTTAFLPENFLNNNLSTMARCKPGDIVIAKGGNTLAKTGILNDNFSEYATCRDIVILRTDSLSLPMKYYVWAYLQSGYGQNALWQTASQTGQPHLTLDYIKTLKVPLFSNAFYDAIQYCYQESQAVNENANAKYKEAETLLLSALALDTFVPSQENTSVKNFSEITASARLDAEYYQKKYDDLFSTIHHAAKNPNVAKVAPLSSVVSIKKSIEPGSDEYGDEGIPFVRVSDISKFEVNPPHIFLDRRAFDIAGLKPKKNTILLSKDGSVGIAYKVNEDMDAITSGALLHLTVTDETVSPDYLTLLLNSFVVGMQAERDVGGSILKHWRVDEIKIVQLPILRESIQRKIAEKIRHSFALREKSKALLKAATRAVEIAIEEDETAAMEFLREKTMQENV